MVKLSDELQQALAQQGADMPLEVEHPITQETFLLISREKFERLQAFIDPLPPGENEQLQLLAKMGSKVGWDDPEMDVYDQLAGD